MNQESDSARAQDDHNTANADSSRAKVELAEGAAARLSLAKLKPKGTRDWRRLCVLIVVAALAFGGGLTLANAHASSPANVAALRNPYVQPFTSTSIWNQPIGSLAQYGSTTLGTFGITRLGLDAGVILQDPTAPLTQVLQNGGQHANRCLTGTLVTSLRIPAAYVLASSGANNEYAVLQADGQTLAEGGQFARCVAGSFATTNQYGVYGTIYGDGLTGALGASLLSTLGGALRAGDIAPGLQGPHHVLRLNVDGELSLFKGTSTTCYRWPATSCDLYGPTGYGGTNPQLTMGALLAIPASVNITTLGLSPAGLELAWTLQNFGGYVGNDSHGIYSTAPPNFAINTEQGDANTAARFTQQWGSSLSAIGIAQILPYLDVVTNNGPSAIGGGGTPRVPLAPPLATNCTPTGCPTPLPSPTPTPTPTATPTP